jgi:hypothetical protein
MNNLYHEQLDKLRIISKLKEGDKLDVRYGMAIQDTSWTWLSWIGRMFSKNSKTESVRALRELYNSVAHIVEQLLETIQSNPNDQRCSQRIFTAVSFAEKLKESLVGLENLATTYSAHPSIVSNIEGIVQDYLMPTYTLIKTTIDDTHHTHTLKEPVISRFVAQY